MSGLEQIVREIEDEAKREAQEIVAKAEADAAALVDEAKKSAAAVAAQIAQASRQELADVRAGGDSALALQKRRVTLETKQALLAETLGKAKEELRAFPADKYFALLALLAAHSAENGEGEMMLNAADKARIPADFADKLNAALPAGRTLSVSGDTRPIDGGFVLKYGDVEENCSFDAIFNARHDEFSDKARDILFA